MSYRKKSEQSTANNGKAEKSIFQISCIKVSSTSCAALENVRGLALIIMCKQSVLVWVCSLREIISTRQFNSTHLIRYVLSFSARVWHRQCVNEWTCHEWWKPDIWANYKPFQVSFKSRVLRHIVEWKHMQMSCPAGLDFCHSFKSAANESNKKYRVKHTIFQYFCDFKKVNVFTNLGFIKIYFIVCSPCNKTYKIDPTVIKVEIFTFQSLYSGMIIPL